MTFTHKERVELGLTQNPTDRVRWLVVPYARRAEVESLDLGYLRLGGAVLVERAGVSAPARRVAWPYRFNADQVYRIATYVFDQHGLSVAAILLPALPADWRPPDPVAALARAVARQSARRE